MTAIIIIASRNEENQHTDFDIVKEIMDILCAVTVDVDYIHHDLQLFHIGNSLNHKLTGISDVCHQHHFMTI